MSSSSASSDKSKKKSDVSEKKNKNDNDSVKMFDNYDEDYRMMMLNYDPSKNKSHPTMTRFEKAFVLGKRATQLAYGAEPLIDVPEHVNDVVEIAEMELEKGLTPFIIERDLGNGTKEIWKIKDMIISLED